VYPADVSPKPNASARSVNPGMALPNPVVVSLRHEPAWGPRLLQRDGSINAVLDVDGSFQ
jgi:hypothetical protein